jgi:hypothetical protein
MLVELWYLPTRNSNYFLSGSSFIYYLIIDFEVASNFFKLKIALLDQ